MPPYEELYAENLHLKQELDEVRAEITMLNAQIEWLRNQLFGAGRSEKLDTVRLLLKLGELGKLNAKAEELQKVSYERRAPR